MTARKWTYALLVRILIIIHSKMWMAWHLFVWLHVHMFARAFDGRNVPVYTPGRHSNYATHICVRISTLLFIIIIYMELSKSRDIATILIDAKCVIKELTRTNRPAICWLMIESQMGDTHICCASLRARSRSYVWAPAETNRLYYSARIENWSGLARHSANKHPWKRCC